VRVFVISVLSALLAVSRVGTAVFDARTPVPPS
jgi:hypothetical protein